MTTIEEKARAYDEALEKARKHYNSKYHPSEGPSGIYLNNADLEEIFPELKESEDERIRKALLRCCDDWEKGQFGCMAKEDVPAIRAYLEKQKEPLTPEEKMNHPLYLEGFDVGREVGAVVAKPAEWSEEYREEDLRTRFAFYTYKDEDSVLYLSNVFVEETSRNKGFGTKILAAAEKVAETLGAIQIRLKVKQDSPANAWYRKNGYGYMAFEDGYDWLEKTLEYLKPAKSAEWDEDDEYLLIETIQHLEELIRIDEKKHCGVNVQYYQRDIDWLKSLRPVKQEWREEDIDKMVEARARKSGTTKSEMAFYRAGIEDTLKSLRSQPKAEWSEEDEKVWQDIFDLCNRFGYDDACRKLKSLRPQPAWKPNKQEKAALRTAIRVLTKERNFPKTAGHLQAILDAFEGKESRKGWKPSEEQMGALKRAVNKLAKTDMADSVELSIMYDNLLKRY